MELERLTAISPIDGRYWASTAVLASYFSEFALLRYRVWVEVEYFIALSDLSMPCLPSLSDENRQWMRDIFEQFDTQDALRIKAIEGVTNHDMKAVEYFLKEKLSKNKELAVFKEFIHFGLTSQDINNTAIPLALKQALADILLPHLEDLTGQLAEMADRWADIAMLAHTHGQPASPTRLGKEISVFVYRLKQQTEELASLRHTAKMGGACGNFNAHKAACPDIDWPSFANRFLLDRFGLHREQVTTQISNYDSLAAVLDTLRRINTILIDFCRDVWTYISKRYFLQHIQPEEVGSSAMPHKVNPIDFENAEGNLGMANALLNHMSQKLPVSRLQRDLTDSTVLRNLGVPIAHSLVAMQSIYKGLARIAPDTAVISSELNQNWAVCAEALQTILRREGYPQPYEALKSLTRTNDIITRETIHQFIDQLDIAEPIKEEMKTITPQNYTGF